jgi:hypothetical protein
MKMLDDVMGLVRRYAPILIAHILLFIWLGFFVVDLKALPNADSIWSAVSNNIDVTLKMVGLSLARWYVLAAFLLAYLTLFEWMRNLVLSAPVLRLALVTRWSPTLLGSACRTMRLAPDAWAVEKALNFQIDRCAERVRQNNQRHPYQWMMDREATLRSYYGMVLLALLAMATWYVSGARLSISPGRVLGTAFLLAAGALWLRWVIGAQFSKRLNSTGYWALNQYERDNDLSKADVLAREREREMRLLAEEDAALRNHPSAILNRFGYRLLGKRSDNLRKWIVHPRWRWQRDWPLIASAATRFVDETIPPPAALQANAFAPRFAALLERAGTGIFILVPSHSRLALAPPGAGSAYAFDARRHDYGMLAIQLLADVHLDVTTTRLSMSGWSKRGFIARIGAYPIEDLVLGYCGTADGCNWYEVFSADLAGLEWERDGAPLEPTLGGVLLRRSAPLELGSSYLLGAILESGLQVRVVLQCFGVQGSDRLVVAWGFLDSRAKDKAVPAIPAWWHASAWKGLIVSPERQKLQSRR